MKTNWFGSNKLIKALDDAEKEKNIETAKEKFQKWHMAYQIGTNAKTNGKCFCGFIGDSVFTPEGTQTGEEGTFKYWYGEDIHEAVLKASVVAWTTRRINNLVD